MKVVNIREARATLASLIEEAQNEPVCLARQGKPVAVLQGVEGNDLETVLLEHSRTFWEEIERRRKSPRPGAPWRPFAADYFADDGCWVAQQTNLRLTRVGWVYATSVCCVALTSRTIENKLVRVTTLELNLAAMRTLVGSRGRRNPSCRLSLPWTR